jgi:hypothetical protein
MSIAGISSRLEPTPTPPGSRSARERALFRRPMTRRRRVDPEQRLDLVWRSILALAPDQRWELMRRLSRPECA